MTSIPKGLCNILESSLWAPGIDVFLTDPRRAVILISMRRSHSYDEAVKQIVLKHVSPQKTLVFLFGSRATKNFRETSDYDVGLFSEKGIPPQQLANIREDLQDSNIPLFVDVVDFSRVPKDFKKLAVSRMKIWNQPTTNKDLLQRLIS